MVFMARYDYVPKIYPNEILAYFAGIIDGEGCLFIGKDRHNSEKHITYYKTLMSVNSTDKILTDWLNFHFGGHLGKYTRKQLSKNSRKDVYYWHATGNRLFHLCKIILPYLVIKTRQAEIMIQMRETYGREHQKGKWGVQSHSEETMKFRESLFLELRSLHTRNYS